MRKAKTIPRTCKNCRQAFLAADGKTNYCEECRGAKHFCKCGCGGLVIGAHREYLPFHSNRDSSSLKQYFGHKRQGKAIRGERNPAKSEEVKRKISEALMGRVCWQEGKTAEEIEATRVKLSTAEIRSSSSHHPRKYIALDGAKYRSSLEVKVADLLFSMGVAYEYEKSLKMPGGIVFPDFTFLFGDQVRCILEVTGSAFERWREQFKEKVRKIRSAWPELPIVVVTYSTSLSYLQELQTLPLVRLWTLGPPDLSDQKVLIVESDHFNFDYSHFLPWHMGKCADFHGHSSTISVVVKGVSDEKGMVVDFSLVKKVTKEAIDCIDHKVFVPRYCIKKSFRGTTHIKFTSKGREHALALPTSEIVQIEGDSTVENISALLAACILNSLPFNVTEVLVRVNEGIGKAAASVATAVSRSLAGEYRLEERPGDFLKTLAFYTSTPMEA